MAYLCLECQDSFDVYDNAKDHHESTGHRIGVWRSDEEEV